MDNKVLVKESTLLDIAEGIRMQLNTTETMRPSDMPGFINSIDTEKVTIDGEIVTQPLSLYSFQNQVVLDIEPPTTPSEYAYQGKLYDGSKLYMKTTLTTVTNGSSSSSAGCTGTVLLIKPNGTQLSVAIPTYTIPSRSETGSSPDSYTYSCKLYLSPDNHVYLRLQRQFQDIRGSNTHDHWTYYQSIYKLNIYSSSLSWTNKVIEVTLGAGMYADSDYIIEDNYIYVCSGNDSFTNYIYGYKYDDTDYKFQKLSTNSIYYTGDNSTTIFLRKNINTYIYFCGPNNWISITRNPNGTYTENKGVASLNTYRKQWKAFNLCDGEIYVELLGYGINPGYEGLDYYKLSSDCSKWEKIITISETATTHTTTISSYLNGAPDFVFQGESSTYGFSSSIVRSDGTFDLTVFPAGTLNYKILQTPIINKDPMAEWSLYKLLHDNNDQYAFFFSIEPENGGYEGYYPPIKYKCVLTADNGSPVLYSTFTESEIIN